MPFIWNDVDYRFIDIDETYDASLYTVYRKLYMELRPLSEVSIREKTKLKMYDNWVVDFGLLQQAAAEEDISKILKKYGAIEKVEIFRLHIGVYCVQWAHVTFVSDRDACFALLNELNNKEEMKLIYKILPASTWHQPSIAGGRNGSDIAIASEQPLFAESVLILRFQYKGEPVASVHQSTKLAQRIFATERRNGV